MEADNNSRREVKVEETKQNNKNESGSGQDHFPDTDENRSNYASESFSSNADSLKGSGKNVRPQERITVG